MNEGLARWAALGGLAFTVLLAVGFALQGDPRSTSDLEWRAYFDDRDNRIALIVAMYVKVVGGFCLFAFIHRLRYLLAQAEGGEARVAGVAYAAGMNFLVLYLASTASMGAIAATPMRLDEGDIPSPELIRFSFQLGYVLLLIPGMIAASLMVAATSMVSLRTPVFPSWFAWFGFLIAAIALFSTWWVPGFAVPVWLAVASFVILLRPQTQPAMAPQTA